MNATGQVRLPGWFSFTLSALDVASSSALSRNLGLPGSAVLVRGFGLRELPPAPPPCAT